MARLGGAQNVIGPYVQFFAHGLELGGSAICQLLRRDALAGRRLLHLLAMLVHAGNEQHVITVKPLETGDGVGGNALIGVADMGRAVGIGNGRGDVVFRFRHVLRSY